ncbi:Histone acetyltransferase [Hibiscus syriacus]|uniref:Histone acetyltransferase n=1 Tax=Hibiscus syriacus TaxID=106335 RepID=A0A6A2Y3Y4_HIBSY|nr:Histone acetyltransferase [Hibiscus syriacus]
MHTVFSVDDFSDSFWDAPLGMNRSQSEWALDIFLEEFSGTGGAIPVSRSSESVIGPSLAEPQLSASKYDGDGDDDVVEIKRPGNQNHSSPPSSLKPKVPIDSDEVQATLKSKLEQAYVVFALSRTSAVKAEASAAQPEDQSLQSKSQVQGSSKAQGQGEPDATPCGMLSVSTTQKKRGVGQLSVDHSTLLKTLSDTNHKYDEAAVDNRILKADIETLRAKVKMAEETVKKVTGINPAPFRHNIANVGLPFVSSPLEAYPVTPVQLQPNNNQFFHQPVPSMATPMHHRRVESCFVGNTLVPPTVNLHTKGVKNVNETSTLQHTPGSELVQDPIGRGVSPSGFMSGWEPRQHAATKNKKQS